MKSFDTSQNTLSLMIHTRHYKSVHKNSTIVEQMKSRDGFWWTLYNSFVKFFRSCFSENKLSVVLRRT